MTTEKTRNENVQRIRFGLQEWIGLLAVALVPAGGFATWGLSMTERVTSIEAIQRTLVDAVAKQDDRREAHSRLDQRVVDLERRIEHLERKP